MSSKRHAVLLIAALSLPLSAMVTPKAHAQQTKIAVVDLQRALNETEDGRKAKAQLQALFKQRQDALDKKQDDLKKMKDDIDRQKNVLSKQALQQRMDQYQQAFVQLQTTYVQFQRELAQKEADLTKTILEKMQAILRHIGQVQGYQLIIERNEGGVIWAPTNLDLTDEVIQKYNAQSGAAQRSSSSHGGAKHKH